MSVTCPFCESEDVELVSPWAGQLITSQMRCLACNTYFEAVREEGGRESEPLVRLSAQPPSETRRRPESDGRSAP